MTRALLLMLSVFSFAELLAQQSDVYVDKEGVMRWGDSKKEVYGFGVNYTVPFAHAYRSGKKLGVDLEKEIDKDVYHFARLGFDAFRVHVWDTEISDSTGNLLENDHLRLFDYMLWKMKGRGIRMLITPIAFWGNGWPERDEKTPGFSYKYRKDACLVNPDAIAAQEKYLFQFLNHVNPYTKLAYKDDPFVVAFEVSNEPHHKGTKEQVQQYIDRMVAAMRKTGCKKPVFYNISHSINRSDAYFASKIDGGTFQWYPTGLGARRELQGNFLPNVDSYPIPFAADAGFKNIAKVVYEFDAADIARSYIYPAMARSFREAGIQWATHFAYDPTYLAYANTEYNTHYMNLIYAPQKALSLKIASEVFHTMPRYQSLGKYPGNASFGPFRVSYEEDLAEMVTDKKFIYTNNTNTSPPNSNTLEEIAGYGNSTVVKYEGNGAYFLDKIGSGVWRLEILPDAIWIDNLFGRNSLKKTVAVINHREWPITISHPDLGVDYKAAKLNGVGTFTVSSETFSATPGVYVLTRGGMAAKISPDTKWRNILLGEYSAPESTLGKTYVIHQPPVEVSAGKTASINASVYTRNAADEIRLHLWAPWGGKVIGMQRVSGYDYTAEIPPDFLQPGYLAYFIEVKTKDGSETFPAGVKGSPNDWDFYATNGYRLAIVNPGSALYLFNAISDTEEVSREWRRGSGLMPTNGIAAEMITSLEKIEQKDPENEKSGTIRDYSMRFSFKSKLAGRTEDLKQFKSMVIKAKSYGNPFPIQVALIDKKANVYGASIQLGSDAKEIILALSDFTPVDQVILPRPYPSFLPYYFSRKSGDAFNISDMETLQISVGPGLGNIQPPFKFGIESIRLE